MEGVIERVEIDGDWVRLEDDRDVIEHSMKLPDSPPATTLTATIQLPEGLTLTQSFKLEPPPSSQPELNYTKTQNETLYTFYSKGNYDFY